MLGRRRLRIGQDDDELVAAEAGGEIAGTQPARDQAADEADRPAADQVAAAVDQRLEAVEVEHQQRDRSATRQQLGKDAIEVARVAEAGQVVGDRGDLCLPIERGVGDRDRGVVGERSDEPELVVGEMRSVELGQPPDLPD